MPVHDSDVILLAKQHISSSELSQPPLLMFPHCLLERLAGQELKPLPRNELPARTIAEFRKTAVAVEAKPWSLHRAATYLRNLCDGGQQSSPPVLRLLTEPKLFAASSLATAAPQDWSEYATQISKPAPPRVITVKRAPVRKRPAAASASTPDGQQEAPADREQEEEDPADAEPEGEEDDAGVEMDDDAMFEDLFASSPEAKAAEEMPPKLKAPAKAKAAAKLPPKAKAPAKAKVKAAAELPAKAPAKAAAELPAKAPAKAKEPAKAPAKAKAAAELQPQAAAELPPQADTRPGCSKCRFAPNGCAQCRRRRRLALL